VGHHGAVDPDAHPPSGAVALPGTWWIGLDSWVLQDGNYPDFVVGERRQFALELGYSRTNRLREATDDAPLRCRYAGRDVTYDVTGLLRRAATEPMRDAFVLDFGLLAYCEWMVLDDLAPPRSGSRLTGEIRLSVDHFAYKDELAQRPGMPPLIYAWTIEEIQLWPDASGAPGRSVPATRTWDHDGAYRLRCSLEEPARPVSFTATRPTDRPEEPR
jgi:hypothetical protein